VAFHSEKASARGSLGPRCKACEQRGQILAAAHIGRDRERRDRCARFAHAREPVLDAAVEIDASVGADCDRHVRAHAERRRIATPLALVLWRELS